MSFDHDAAYRALFGKLKALPGFVTRSRVLRHWTDVPPEEMPALFMAMTNQVVEPRTGFPGKWTLRGEVYVYCTHEGTDAEAQQDDDAPQAVLNARIGEIAALFNPHPITGRTDLGVPGIEWAKIDGAIQTDEGTLGTLAVAIIPFAILAT